MRYCGLWQEVAFWFLEKLNWFHLTDLITLVLLMWKWVGLFFEEKSSFKMLGLTFSSRLDWGSYIISIVKSAFKKIGALIRSMNCLSSDLFCISTNLPYVCPSFATSLEPLTCCWNVASWSLFCRYYFGNYSYELAQLAPLSDSRGNPTHYSDRLHCFSGTIPRCYKDVCVNSFFSSHSWTLQFSAHRMLFFDL